MDILPKALERVSVQPAPVKSAFDEARETIDEWERADPRASHIGLVLDGECDIVAFVAGDAMKPSAAAGLMFEAATLLVAQ